MTNTQKRILCVKIKTRRTHKKNTEIIARVVAWWPSHTHTYIHAARYEQRAILAKCICVPSVRDAAQSCPRPERLGSCELAMCPFGCNAKMAKMMCWRAASFSRTALCVVGSGGAHSFISCFRTPTKQGKKKNYRLYDFGSVAACIMARGAWRCSRAQPICTRNVVFNARLFCL